MLALDHRGLRTPVHFRLGDCADDAAAILRHEGIEGALAVGYSMGGPIGCLVPREYPELIAGLVLCATSPDWQEPYMKRGWRLMSLLRLELGLFPNAAWRARPARARATRLGRHDLGRCRALPGQRPRCRRGRARARPLRRARVAGPPAPAARSDRPGRGHPRPDPQAARARGVARARAARGAGHHLAITTHAEPFIAALLDSLAEVGAPVTLERG